MRKFFQWLKRLFTSAAAIIEKYITPSIEVVENIKLFIDSPVADLLTAVIPGGIDDMLKDKIRKILPIVLIDLRIADQCSKAGTPEAVLQCSVKALATYTNDAKNLALHNIAVLLSKYLADGKLSTRELIHLTEEAYQQKFKTAA